MEHTFIGTPACDHCKGMVGVCTCMYVYLCAYLYMCVFVYVCVCVGFVYVCVHVCVNMLCTASIALSG